MKPRGRAAVGTGRSRATAEETEDLEILSVLIRSLIAPAAENFGRIISQKNCVQPTSSYVIVHGSNKKHKLVCLHGLNKVYDLAYSVCFVLSVKNI